MSELLPGTEVLARGLRWDVVLAQPSGAETLYRLRCREGKLLGEELDFLSPLESITPVTKEMRPENAAALADWRVYHQAFVLDQALGPAALLCAQPGRLTIQPYQLVPVMRALQMSRPRLLLADGVGLGKTVEAGLILAELIARRRAHRILIVCPGGPLLEQWRLEMRERFGLRFRVLDRDSLQEIRYSSELTTNPFDTVALGIVSLQFARQDAVQKDIERSQWDVVVMDEAHHCARLAEGSDREETLQRQLAEVLSRRSDSLLLLTATPHDGFDRHFASLVELLDPSLVDGRGDLRGDGYRRHVVRRLKTHIRDPKTGGPMFRERIVLPRPVAFGPQEQPRFSEFQRRLLALVAPQLRRAMRLKQYGEVLSFVMLLKRSVSSVAACRETLAAVSARLERIGIEGLERQESRKERLRSLRALNRRLARFGTLSEEEERERATLEAEEIAAELATGATADEEDIGDITREIRRDRDRLARVDDVRADIDALRALATEALSEDPKMAALVEEIASIRADEPKANVLVFTEYIDSQVAAVAALRSAIRSRRFSGEILALSGESAEAGEDEVRSAAQGRRRVLERFGNEDGLILVTTDTTAEGLNLHARCHHLVHLELPYNPNRLEQRNGRIDRFGQTKDPRVLYLYLRGTFEERLLLRLVSKYERQRARLTFVPNTLGILAGDAASETVRLLEGIIEEEGLLFTPAGSLDFDSGVDEDTSSPAYRELLEEVDRALTGFERAAKSHAWLAEAGLGAEESVLAQATAAHSSGERLAGTDLVGFVLDAVRADSSDPNAVIERDGVIELRLSTLPAWTSGLEEVPGYDPETRTLRLTADLDRTAESDKRPLGYLGRAHPIVRRALERVRLSQFGGTGALLDRRIAAARFEEANPAVLFTFSARLASAVGIELERVIGVLVRSEGATDTFLSSEQWAPLCAADRALPPAGIWKRHFEGWGDEAAIEARQAAASAFSPAADAFRTGYLDGLARERASVDGWLRVRADEICGKSPTFETRQLFEEASPDSAVASTDPAARIAAFALAGAVSSRARSDASGVLKLHAARTEELERRGLFSPPAVEPLGMLLLVPAAGPES